MDIITGKITDIPPFDGVNKAFGFQSEAGSTFTVVSKTWPEEFSPKVGARAVIAGRIARPGVFGAVAVQEVKRYLPGMMAEFIVSRHIPGLAKARARQLVDNLGEKLDLTFLCCPAKLEELPGVGSAVIENLKTTWREHRRSLALFDFLSRAGIEVGKIKRIERVTAGSGLGGYDANPYKIIMAKGVTLEDADKIAFGVLKLRKNNPMRIRAALKIAMDGIKTEGLCGMPRNTLINKARQMLNGPKVEEIKAQITSYIEDGHFVAKVRGREIIIYPAFTYNKELRIARNLISRLERPVDKVDISDKIRKVERDIGVTLAEAQRKAVEMVFSNRLSIITGGPGVGKTTTLKTILGVAGMTGGDRALAAPTGAAAKRMGIATDHRYAKTIHRLLQFREGRFTHDRSNPIEAGYVFIDEHSMTDINLMDALLDGVADNARLVFLGDVDQLPSVGSGRILNDMIDSGVIPVTRLDVIYRQGENSRITEAAHAINAGESPDLEDRPGSDFTFRHADKVDDLLKGIVEAVATEIPGRLGFDPLSEIQVICPQRKGVIGTTEVNKLLRERLNPQGMKIIDQLRKDYGDKYAERCFVPGDKVIQTRNNYEKEVFNGEIGYVTRRQAGQFIVEFDGNRKIPYDYGDQDEIMLAYAITVHKSQGTESPVIVMPVHSENDFMLKRNLIYTGITRGKDHVMLIGERGAVKKAARNASNNERYSLLAENLVDLARKSPHLSHLDLDLDKRKSVVEDEMSPVVLDNESTGLFG